MVRASMLDVLGQEYILTARAKGAGERRVLLNHALRNALIPTLTIVGFSFAYLITGAVLTETIFSWPGHRLLCRRCGARARPSGDHRRHHRRRRGLPVANLVTDLAYAFADPRVRLGADALHAARRAARDACSPSWATLPVIVGAAIVVRSGWSSR